MTDLNGRVVVVTGGQGGVGRDLVAHLAERGATVVSTRRRQAAEGDAATPGRSEVVDVSDASAVEAFITDTVRREGRLDGVVALVGAFRAGTAQETSPEEWRRLVTTNLDTAFYLARAALPHMLAAGRGRIITVGARAALAPRAGLVAYSVAKEAVLRLTQALAEDVRGTGVTANCLAPGAIDVPANRASRPDADRTTWVPTRAMSAVIAWLLSDEAAIVNGAVLPLEGPA